MRTLQDILGNLPFDDLPPAWQDHNLELFSSTKGLWDYQKKALQFALKTLWKYYQDLQDFAPGEPDSVNEDRKERLWEWYRDNGLEENLDIPLQKQKRDVRALLEDYYTSQGGRIPYRHFINRMGFWMATGSGKSLVLIKLIEMLWRLMRRGEIPTHPILVLTARDDLLAQLKDHVGEFNAGHSDFRIHLEDLKAYPERERMFLPLMDEDGVTVFFYRADNLSDAQKERIVDFRNYENHGRWYVLLDEAHKGDREDSKRQHIYSILSRNGFLFNFSATFTDLRDILTTAYNFNLSEFVRAGYGKHIAILKQENRAFGDNEDYTGEEKQRVVLKALLMLAYARKAQEALPPNSHAYHRPLMLTLVNSVNTRDADLKLFFRELERIGQGHVDAKTWRKARKELWDELAEGPEWLFEDQQLRADQALFDSLTQEEVLRLVYNAPGPGEIEVLLRPSNRQEMAFKLKSADQTFALIKIGDISNWLKEELEGYEVIEGYEDEGFFARLNEDDSPINILMGSRTFYEGWDSNRPNVITYINIGIGTEAKKFILQSTGRGVRIEPLPGRRKRLLALHNAREVQDALFQDLKDHSHALETLFIFGTNRKALQTVIAELDQQKRREAEHEVALKINHGAFAGHPLLVPVYRSADRTIVEGRAPRKFEVADEELGLLRKYVGYLDDPRLLVARHNAVPAQISVLRRCLQDPNRYFNTQNGLRYGSMDILLRRLFSYFDLVPKEWDGLAPLRDQISHFLHIKVFLKHIGELLEKIQRVASSPEQVAELEEQYRRGQLTFDQVFERARAFSGEEALIHEGQTLRIKLIAQHYYVPLLLSDSERIDWVRHVIRHKSEVFFLNALENCLRNNGKAFASLDWWAFSKIDEALDKVYIPFYDPRSNRVRRFLPDFVFWLQKGTDYAIVFVDPKGMAHTDYQYKLDGFRHIFLDEAGRPRCFPYDGLDVRINLLLYTRDANQAPAQYRDHWFDQPDQIPAILTGSSKSNSQA